MKQTDNKRRDFIKKIGLGMLAGFSFGQLKASNPDLPVLSIEQEAFLKRYELWMDEFAEMTSLQSEDQYNAMNNKRLMLIADQAEEFKSELQLHLKDENFARHYLQRIERLSEKIL